MGLWKGLGPNIGRNAIINAAELASYDQIKSGLLASGYFSDNIVTHITAGLGAGFVAVCVGSPVDVVKSRVMGARCVCAGGARGVLGGGWVGGGAAPRGREGVCSGWRAGREEGTQKEEARYARDRAPPPPTHTRPLLSGREARGAAGPLHRVRLAPHRDMTAPVSQDAD